MRPRFARPSPMLRLLTGLGLLTALGLGVRPQAGLAQDATPSSTPPGGPSSPPLTPVGPPPMAAPTPSPDSLAPWGDADEDRLDSIREGVRAQVTIQQVLRWYTATEDEESMEADTWRGRESIFSKQTLQFLKDALSRTHWDAENRRALEYLRYYVAMGYIRLRVAPFTDRLSRAQSNARVRLSWRPEPVPYLELDAMAASERDPARRQELQSASARVWADQLNPLLAERDNLIRSLAVEAGFPSYVALSREVRAVDLTAFLDASTRFLKDTDGLYRTLLEQQAREVLNKSASNLTRADLSYLARPPRLLRFFPAELEQPALEALVEGMGLSLKTTAGTDLRIDAAVTPYKTDDALCVPVRVPRDIRLTFLPQDGPRAAGWLFHEAAHALHFANTLTPYFEFQQLGTEGATEGFGELFHGLWGDPAWLDHYRRLVIEHNRRHSRHPVPVMTGPDMARAIRYHVFWQLYTLRRTAWARLLYESILYGAPPEVYQRAWKGPVSDAQRVYKEVFSQAYGFELTDEEALRFRTDTDEFFFAADFARALLFGAQVEDALRKDLGLEWFASPAAGERLKGLWREGTRFTAEELLQQVGAQGAGFEAVKLRMDRLLEAAEGLEKRP